MKKFLITIITIILLIAGYLVYAKSTCTTPYQEIFVIIKDSSGTMFIKTISDVKKCEYVGWKI